MAHAAAQVQLAPPPPDGRTQGLAPWAHKMTLGRPLQGPKYVTFLIWCPAKTCGGCPRDPLGVLFTGLQCLVYHAMPQLPRSGGSQVGCPSFASGGSPPQKEDASVHPEISTGTPVESVWPPLSLASRSRRSVPVQSTLHVVYCISVEPPVCAGFVLAATLATALVGHLPCMLAPAPVTNDTLSGT